MGLSFIIPDLDASQSNLGKVTLVEETVATAISIIGNSSVSGSGIYQISYTPIYTTVKGVTWSIVSGGEYATISSAGVVTALQGANHDSVTIRAVYNEDNTIIAEKTIDVTYASDPYDDSDILEMFPVITQDGLTKKAFLRNVLASSRSKVAENFIDSYVSIYIEATLPNYRDGSPQQFLFSTNSLSLRTTGSSNNYSIVLANSIVGTGDGRGSSIKWLIRTYKVGDNFAGEIYDENGKIAGSAIGGVQAFSEVFLGNGSGIDPSAVSMPNLTFDRFVVYAK